MEGGVAMRASWANEDGCVTTDDEPASGSESTDPEMDTVSLVCAERRRKENVVSLPVRARISGSAPLSSSTGARVTGSIHSRSDGSGSDADPSSLVAEMTSVTAIEGIGRPVMPDCGAQLDGAGSPATVDGSFDRPVRRRSRTARVSPTSERQKLRRMLQSARAMRTSSGVVGDGTLMLLPVARRRRRRRGGRLEKCREATAEETAEPSGALLLPFTAEVYETSAAAGTGASGAAYEGEEAWGAGTRPCGCPKEAKYESSLLSVFIVQKYTCAS
jgi:hypothetical protein